MDILRQKTFTIYFIFQIFSFLILVFDPEPQKIGTFTNIFHDIAGTAYAVDSSTILIRGFEYDGEGPDAFFLAGSSGRPSRAGEVVLPFPALGRQYDYNDKDIPILGRSAALRKPFS